MGEKSESMKVENKEKGGGERSKPTSDASKNLGSAALKSAGVKKP